MFPFRASLPVLCLLVVAAACKPSDDAGMDAGAAFRAGTCEPGTAGPSPRSRLSAERMPCQSGWCWENYPEGGLAGGMALGTGPDGVWITDASTVVRFDGSAWRGRCPPIGLVPPGWTIAMLAAAGPDDAWAVARDFEGLRREVADPAAAHLLRWDGRAWSIALERTWGVWVGSSTNVWAWGDRVLAWSNGGWNDFTAALWEKGLGPNVFQGLVAGTAPDDVWAAFESGARTALLHFDGREWSLVASIAAAPADLWMASRNDGWMLAKDANGTTVWRFEGAEWQPMPWPWSGDSILHVRGRASDDVWFTGLFERTTPDGPAGATFAVRWNGRAFAREEISAPPLARPAPPHHVAADGSLFVVVQGSGHSQSGRLLRRGPDGKWATELAPAAAYGHVASDRLPSNVFAARSPHDFWLLGARAGLLAHFADGRWHEIPTPPGAERILAAEAEAAGRLTVLAKPARTGVTLIGHWDGTAWQTAEYPDSLDVLGRVGDELWALGGQWEQGGGGAPGRWAPAVVRRDSGTWAPVPGLSAALASFSPGPELYGWPGPCLWGPGPSDVWLGSMVHWDGASLRLAGPDLGTSATCVTGTGPHDVWAFGAPEQGRATHYSDVFHYDGNAWTALAGPSNRSQTAWSFLRISASGAGSARAAGLTPKDGKGLFRWDGGAWTKEADFPDAAVSMGTLVSTPDGEALVASPDGAVWRYRGSLAPVR